jgi:heme A synthase
MRSSSVKQTYRVLAGLVAFGVLVQAGAVAFGWFDAISGLENGLVIDQNYEGNAGHALHGIVGFYVMPALALILLIVSFLAAKQVPGARKWGGIIFGLTLLQVVLAILAFAVAPVIGALHGLNALLLFAAAVRATLLTREAQAGGVRLPRQRSETTTTAEGSSLPV